MYCLCVAFYPGCNRWRNVAEGHPVPLHLEVSFLPVRRLEAVVPHAWMWPLHNEAAQLANKAAGAEWSKIYSTDSCLGFDYNSHCRGPNNKSWWNFCSRCHRRILHSCFSFSGAKPPACGTKTDKAILWICIDGLSRLHSFKNFCTLSKSFGLGTILQLIDSFHTVLWTNITKMHQSQTQGWLLCLLLTSALSSALGVPVQSMIQ